MYELVTWDKSNTLEIPKTISGNDFSLFLDMCFENADFFSLNQAPWTDAICTDLQMKVEPFLLKEILTPTWFGYDYSVAPPEDYRQLKVYLYNVQSTAKDIFRECFTDIFLRNYRDGKIQDSLQNLEDLCFFQQGNLFVGTVSHEHLLCVSPPGKEFEKSLMKLGDWNYTEQAPINIQQYI